MATVMKTLRILTLFLLIVSAWGLSQCTTPGSNAPEPETTDIDTAIMGRWQRCESMDRFEGLSEDDWRELGLQGDPVIEDAEEFLRASLRLMENHTGLIYAQSNYTGDCAEVEWAVRQGYDAPKLEGSIFEISTTRNGEHEAYPHAIMLEDSILYLSAIYKARFVGSLQADLASLKLELEQAEPSKREFLQKAMTETQEALRMLDAAPNFTIWRAYQR